MRANEVVDFDEELARLAERMTALMHDAHGVGLAATQVGVLRRLFVFADDEEHRALVNPRIVERSTPSRRTRRAASRSARSACPSSARGKSSWRRRISTGRPIRLELEGLAARVAQHEVDHLDGVLIIQRTDDASRREALALLRPQPVIGVGLATCGSRSPRPRRSEPTCSSASPRGTTSPALLTRPTGPPDAAAASARRRPRLVAERLGLAGAAAGAPLDRGRLPATR